MAELGIFLLRFAASLLLTFFAPIPEHLVAQLANLLESARFGCMHRASFGDRLINHIRNPQQTSAQVGTSGEAFIQTRFVLA